MGPLASFYAANLTPDDETGIGKRTDAELARAITTGVLHDGRISVFMRYSTANLSNEDLTAVVSYLRSLPPVKHEVPAFSIPALGKVIFSFFPLDADMSPLPAHVEKGAEPSVERGRYLAENVALCVACHSKIDMSTFKPTGPKAAGGAPDPSHGDDADMEFVSPNLKPWAMGKQKVMVGGIVPDFAFALLYRSMAKAKMKPGEHVAALVATTDDGREVYRGEIGFNLPANGRHAYDPRAFK
jgi:cytochrome c553